MGEGREIERGKKLLIPPFLTPQGEKREAKRGERRVKVKIDRNLEGDVVKISRELYTALDNPQEVEVVAPGGSSHEKRRVFKVSVDDGLTSNEIYMSEESARAIGIAENTVVTIKKK